MAPYVFHWQPLSTYSIIFPVLRGSALVISAGPHPQLYCDWWLSAPLYRIMAVATLPEVGLCLYCSFTSLWFSLMIHHSLFANNFLREGVRDWTTTQLPHLGSYTMCLFWPKDPSLFFFAQANPDLWNYFPSWIKSTIWDCMIIPAFQHLQLGALWHPVLFRSLGSRSELP